jgi:hypothetical protein
LGVQGIDGCSWAWIVYKASRRQASDIEWIAEGTWNGARPNGVFVSALASLGLLQVTKTEDGSEDLIANSPVSEMFLDKSKESYLGDIITMFDKRLYKAWNKLVGSLRTNKPVTLQMERAYERFFQ